MIYLNMFKQALKGVKKLDENQQSAVKALLTKYSDLFAKSNTDRGHTHLVQHKINTGNNPPFKQRPRHLPLSQRQAERDEIDKMLSSGVIEESESPWASPVVLVKKKDGSIRYCIDYRRLNDLTVKDSYPLPLTQDCLDELSGSSWFSTLDLQSGYWQIEVDPNDRQKTAFASRSGLYQFKVMPFGLTNAPGTFERLMEKVLKGLHYEICLVYLDDVVVKSQSFESHLDNLSLVFDRLRSAGLKLNPKKCKIFQKEVSFLGHVVSEAGISTDPSKISVVKDWPTPASVKEVRSFVGFCSYYRKFIREFSSIAKPLLKLTENGVKFEWDDDCEAAFDRLKCAMISAPVLAYPSLTGEFLLDTDASGVGIGAVLSQVQNGEEKVIGYFSRTLSKSERRYCVTRRELLAVVEAIKHFHHYLYGLPFVVRTDHGSLRWLLNFRNLEGQLARWSELLGTYNFTLIHRAGKQHVNADFLSRPPCGNCSYCERVELREKDKVSDHCDCPKKCSVRKVVAEDTFQKVDSWLNSKTCDELRNLQESDPDIGFLLKEKEVGHEKPKWEDISGKGQDLKRYWAQWERMVLRNGLLYREWIEPSEKQPVYQLIVPRCLKNEVLSLLHEQKCSGHLGIRKVIGRLRRRFYWVCYKVDVKDWCRKCPQCQKRNSPSKRHRAPLKQYPVGVPFERIGIDILGPLPETFHGNKYIVVIGDYFSKWIEAFATPDQEAETVANVLVDGFVSRYGIPKQIHSDQGSQFESKLFKSLCDLLGIDKTRTTAHHPQSNGFVERYNRTLQSMLSKMIEGDQRSWDRVLPIAMLAYRSSEHDTTGVSPARMLFGREIQLPVDLLLGCPPDETVPVDCNVPYVIALRDQLQNVHDLARDNMSEASQRQKRGYDHRQNFKSYETGSSVYLFEPVRKKGISPKLESSWTGPWLVVGKVSDLVYKIQKSQGSKAKFVHHDRLKPSFTILESWLKGKDSVSLDTSQPELTQNFQVEDREQQESISIPVLDESESTTEPLDQEVRETVDTVTKSGRKVRAPKHLQDYEIFV